MAPKVGGTLVVQNPGTAATAGRSNRDRKRNPNEKRKTIPPNMPGLLVDTRLSPFCQMLLDPKFAPPALPPVALPARAIPLKQTCEVLLTTDANGNCGLTVAPLMASHYNKVATWTGTTPATYAGATNDPEYASFINNFQFLVPLVLEVTLEFTGSTNALAGRMYGIAGNGYTGDVTAFPLEPNGCEALTNDGISCTWYSTAPVWANPAPAGTTSPLNEWMDCGVTVALIGGPASVANIATARIFFHLAGIPKPAVSGLTPMWSLPDPSAQFYASLIAGAETGPGANALSLRDRNKHRNKKVKIADVLRRGKDVVGALTPWLGKYGPAVQTAAEALAMVL